MLGHRKVTTVFFLACSCRKGDLYALQRREHKRVDRRRRGDSPAGGLHHPLRPLLEAVSDGQAGVPARRDDLHPAEAEGRSRFFFFKLQ